MPVQKKPAAKKSSTKKTAEKKSTVKKPKVKKKVVAQVVPAVQSEAVVSQVAPVVEVQATPVAQSQQTVPQVATPEVLVAQAQAVQPVQVTSTEQATSVAQVTAPEVLAQQAQPVQPAPAEQGVAPVQVTPAEVASVVQPADILAEPLAKPSHKILFIILIFFGLLLAATVGLFLFLPMGSSSQGWKNITELKAYAATMDEFPKMDNNNIIKPDYTKFWTEKSKGGSSYLTKRLNRFLQFLRVKQGEFWSAEAFKGQLERLAESRLKRGFTGNFIHKLIPNPGSQFIIVGDLQGAFHSLVCNVGKWIELGILNADFKIVKPDVRIVFIGNLVDRSPLSMEALSLVMRLMEENPDMVFVLRGNHEYKNYWHDYGFKQELMIRAVAVSKEAIPLGDTVNKFFDTLSSAIFLGVQPNTGTTFVSISHQGRSEDEKEMYPIDESGFVDFLKTAEKNLTTFNLKDAKPAGQSDIVIKAIIKSEKKRKTFQTMDGLRMLSPDKGSSAWSYLSCPTTSYQEGVKFFFDAFGVLEVGAAVENWFISLYNQDVRMRQGYKLKTFNLMSGTQTAGEGVTGAPATTATQAPAVTQAPVSATVPQPVVATQPAVQQAQLVTQAAGQPTAQQIAEYQAKMATYNAQVAAYQAQQKQAVDQSSQNQVQPVAPVVQSLTPQQTAEYQAKMALYNAKMVLYEAQKKQAGVQPVLASKK